MAKRILSSLVLGCAVALGACSSSDGGGGSPQGVIPQAFDKYCVGTLKADQKLMKPMNGGGWMGDGTLRASAGTTFLVSVDFHQWSGFVVQQDGSVAKIDQDFDKGLVKDTDFTSDCATDAALQPFAQNPKVLLKASTLYPTKDMSGTACTVDAGTSLTTFMYSSGGFGSTPEPAQVGADEIKAKCGYESGYSNDFSYGELLPKK